jgi:hypothetical protein
MHANSCTISSGLIFNGDCILNSSLKKHNFILIFDHNNEIKSYVLPCSATLASSTSAAVLLYVLALGLFGGQPPTLIALHARHKLPLIIVLTLSVPWAT